MADLPARDAVLLLDMLLAARDAQSFVEGLDHWAFLTSRLQAPRCDMGGPAGPSRPIDRNFGAAHPQ